MFMSIRLTHIRPVRLSGTENRHKTTQKSHAEQRFSMRGTRIQVFPLTPGPRLTESDLQQFAGIVA